MKVRITFQPKGKIVAVRQGENVLQAGLKNRVYIPNRCGGRGSCAACKIKLLTKDDAVSFVSSREHRMLNEQELADGYRLACQTRVYARCEVSILDDSMKSIVQRARERLRDGEEERDE